MLWVDVVSTLHSRSLRRIFPALSLVFVSAGSVSHAADRLPQAPSITTELPERMGGGFLFVLGTTVWRAERWLARPEPLFAANGSIVGLVVTAQIYGVASPSAIELRSRFFVEKSAGLIRFRGE